jgi:hypothetical protein
MIMCKIRYTLFLTLTSLSFALSSKAQEMPSIHYARTHVEPIEDSDAFKQLFIKWKGFVEQHAPEVAPWEIFTDSNGRFHHISFMQDYGEIHERQDAFDNALAKHQRLGLPSLKPDWIKMSRSQSKSLWKFRPDLSYIKGPMDSEANPFRQLYFIYPKKARFDDWIQGLILLNEMDASLEHSYHRYVYECQFGEDLPLFVVVVPGKDKLSHAKAVDVRRQARAGLDAHVKRQELVKDATRKIEDVRLKYHPDLSYKGTQ